jgi:hypothetical protein
MVDLQEIKSIEDVKTFAAQLVSEGTNFHPDEDFEEYVVIGTGEPSYSKKEATLRNKLLDQCFTVCEKEGACIYDTCYEVFIEANGMKEFISSSEN